ncbi:MAG: class I SAM-dependent methyltransferase [Mycobacteriaceae bacterium]|nr:class I SAM-dependent methyltransferase [Mycobacteriaceae bacterium]
MAETESGSLRADHDDWDIVSSVGYTALIVAGWRAIHGTALQPLVRDEYAQHFITASRDPYLTDLLANPPTSEVTTAFPRLYGVQTRFFDDFFRASADAGVRQAVIVAAGLDSRAYRLNWPSQTTVFEIDLPKVLEFKVDVLARRGAEPKARRIDVPADLREDWPASLHAAGFDPQRPSAWSVEGLLPYLTGETQDALFAGIDRLSASGSYVAVGALGSRFSAQQFAALEAIHPGLTLSDNTDFSGLAYDDSQHIDPSAWLATHGWTVDPVRTTLELQASYGRTPPTVDVRIDSHLHSQYITAVKAAQR